MFHFLIRLGTDVGDETFDTNDRSTTSSLTSRSVKTTSKHSGKKNHNNSNNKKKSQRRRSPSTKRGRPRTSAKKEATAASSTAASSAAASSAAKSRPVANGQLNGVVHNGVRPPADLKVLKIDPLEGSENESGVGEEGEDNLGPNISSLSVGSTPTREEQREEC